MNCLAKILMLIAALCGVVAAGASGVPPAAALNSPPLPPLKAVIDKVLDYARREDQNDREFQARYAYKRTKITDERDAEGKLEKHEQRVSQHVPTPKQEVTAPAPSLLPSTNASSPQRLLDKKDFPLDKELLKHFQLTILRRELLNGRPTLVVDFKPARTTPPVTSFKDQFLNKVAGQLRIDENDFAVVQTDVHLTEAVNIIAGVVGSVGRLSYHFVRERTPDGFWFTKVVKWHLEAREFLVHKIRDHSEESFEVRKVR